MTRKVTILGLGNFGYALLKYLDDRIVDGLDIELMGYDRKPGLIDYLVSQRKHSSLHIEYKIQTGVIFTNDMHKAVEHADVIILSISSSSIIEVINKVKDSRKKGVIILNTAKALSPGGKTYSQEFDEHLIGQDYMYSMLSGGTIASDLFLGYPLGATLGSTCDMTLDILSGLFQGGNLDIQKSKDTYGVELAGAFKNIGAILAGYIKGAGYPYGTETYYLTKFLEEVQLLCIDMGANEKTFTISSQCWGNDFWMSCTGATRNRKFGELLGSGIIYQDALDLLEKESITVEGVNSLNSLDILVHKYDDLLLLRSMIGLRDNTFDLYNIYA